MSLFLLIRLIEWLVTGIAVTGIGVSIYAAWDTLLDLLASEGRPGYELSKLAADIGISSALGGVIGHLLFLSLGVFSLTATPNPQRYAFALLYEAIFVCMQAVMLSVQVRVLVKRRQLRESLKEGSQ